MTAQIIFFIAVGLFIVLILRRFVAVEKTLSILARASQSTSDWLLTRLTTARNRLRERARQVQRSQQRTRSSHIPTIPPPAGVNANFWKEEELGEKPEIMTHYEEGEALLKSGKSEEAENFFLRAATRSPKDPKVYARLGLIYLARKNYSDAIEALKVAVKLDKYNPSRYYNLALAYEGKSDNQRAIATIREAISLDPVSARYRTLLEQLLNKK